MLEVGNWAIGVEAGEVILDSSKLGGEGDEHDEGSLTVADIMDLSLSYPVYISEGCRKIEFRHIMEGEIPEVENYWTERFVTVSVPP